MCTFGLSGCARRAHSRPWRFKTPPKFQEKTPKRGKKERTLWRRGRKSAKIWASHPSGPTLSEPQNSEHPLGAGLAKVGQNCLAKVGLVRMAKVGLAKVGLSRWKVVTRVDHPSQGQTSQGHLTQKVW